MMMNVGLNYRKKNILLQHRNKARTVFASDRQSFPLQIAGLATVSKESVNLPAIVFQKNAFELNVGDTVQITNPQNGELLNIKVPQFDTIVSNLPSLIFAATTRATKVMRLRREKYLLKLQGKRKSKSATEAIIICISFFICGIC